MKKMIGQLAASALIMALLSQGAMAGDDKYSGYLGKSYYDKMEKVDLKSGLKAKRWVSKSFNSDDYDTAVIDTVILYPELKPSAQVSAEVLQEMSAELTKLLRTKIGTKVTVVDAPQKGAVKVSAALTGVVTDDENLKPYEVIPVAAIFAAASKAKGNRDQEVHVFLEVKVTDSMSGETLLALVREVDGEKLKDKKEQLTMKHVQTNLEQISSDAQSSLSSYVN